MLHLHDPTLIHPAIAELVALFEGPLAAVQFPGVDQHVLRGLVEQVQAHANQVEALRAQLDELHGALADAQAKLARTAEQGHAYARVFAAEEPALAEQVAAIVLPNAEERRRRKPEVVVGPGAAEPLRLPPRRGRRPKTAEASPASTGTALVL